VEQIPTDLTTTTTTTISETTAAEAVDLSAAVASTTSTSCGSEEWAGRRRPALKTSKCDVRTETTSKIGQLAEEKKTIYRKN